MAKDKVFTEKEFSCDGFAHPSAPGVYAVLVFERLTMNPLRVVYIGSSKNIHKRVMNPCHIFRRIFSITRSLCVSVWCYETDDFINIEKSLIIKYRPRFNRRHNG